MNNIELSFVNGEFFININGNLLKKETDIDKAIDYFKNIVNDNDIMRAKNWNIIESEIKDIKSESLIVNKDYKTLEYGKMKYFYRTDKTFYIREGNMIPIVGRFDIFNFVIHLIEDNKIKNEVDILEFLFNILKGKGNYRVKDNSLIVTSSGFNYGLCEYNFLTNKINKGATIEKSSFELFKTYVAEIIKF